MTSAVTDAPRASKASAAEASDAPPVATPPTSLRKSPNRAFAILGGVAVLVALLIAGYALATRGKESTDDAQIDADVVPIAARVGGTVAHVAVRDNQPVKKGDLLIEIDPSDYVVREKEAEADLDAARAQAAAADANVQIAEASSRGGLSSAKAVLSGSSMGVRSADAQIDAAKAALAHAEVDAQKANTDLARAKDLFARNAVTQTNLDDAQARRDAAAAALAQARAQVAATEEGRRVAASRVDEARGRVEQSAPIDAQIASARAADDLAHARVKASEAAVEQAKLQLSYTHVTAPCDGVVSKLGAHEGQLLQNGQPIVELVPATTFVVANFKETQMGRMRPGQRALVTVDAYPGRELEGRVESISGGTGARFSLLPPENATGNFVKVVQRVPVRIEWVQPPPVPLRAGMSVDVTVIVK